MKISEIAINNYRAFYNEKGEELSKYRIKLGTAKNLLIYGENGSGKSSLFKGLKDFFISAVDPKRRLIRNVFSDALELEEEPFVEVTFNRIGEENSIFRFSHDPHQTNTNQEFLRTVMMSKSFMTYRDLMRIHFF
ncbi:AAA family ATPase [Bacteroides fragilis]